MTKVKERDRHRRIVTDTIKLEEPSCKVWKLTKRRNMEWNQRDFVGVKWQKHPSLPKTMMCVSQTKNRDKIVNCVMWSLKDVFCRRTTKSFTLSSSSVVSLYYPYLFLFIYLFIFLKVIINRDGSQNLMDVAYS